MRYRFEQRPDAWVAVLRGPLIDGPEVRQFGDAVHHCCQRGARRVVIDCAGVTRVSPHGLGALLTALAVARNVGGRLTLARVPGPLRSLLMITDFRRVFECHPTVDAAAKALCREGPTAPPSP